ncbi:2-oxoacid dehydrogenases acyltransferase-domain-containing protein [Glomus cerebriforme]|uniref:Acetyltransferase component of pyruvate dehydrogenase complex n=1 Tax=Glomus cerebriforme TaxID=658196 RepID=A0A397TKK9_9GLOM|nr:2-oxoacid dehydrogenases acyltransferase-domain-containing protein [Glomus cerebriforme]
MRDLFLAYPPHSIISMPALSPTMSMGNVGTWQKKIGDDISPGDVLVEIETDKAQMDFECQDEGYLAKILVESGTKDVKIGTPIAILVEEKKEIEQFTDYVAEKGPEMTETKKAEPIEQKEEVPPQQTESKTATTDHPTTGRIFASPVARRLAHERGISLDQVTGTGPKGRITKADVESFVKHEKPVTPIIEPTSAYTDIPLSNMRKVIAERLTESKVLVPHYYLTIEVNMDKVLQLRETLNNESEGKYKLSVNDFIIKSSASALMVIPEVNSMWNNDFIRQYHNADISVATATSSGLITPIVTNAQSKGLATISNQVKELAGRAREGKLAPHEYQGGSFTISNLGMFGIKSFTAIINPPQSCILAVGTTEQKLVPDSSTETGYRVVNTMHVTLSCDHRVVDGAVGSQWLKEWKSYIENPLKLLL